MNHLIEFTEKVWNFYTCTEGKLDIIRLCNKECRALMIQGTEPGIHEDRGGQGVTDGHIPVIGHHSQEEVAQLYKK